MRHNSYIVFFQRVFMLTFYRQLCWQHYLLHYNIILISNWNYSKFSFSLWNVKSISNFLLFLWVLIQSLEFLPEPILRALSYTLVLFVSVFLPPLSKLSETKASYSRKQTPNTRLTSMCVFLLLDLDSIILHYVVKFSDAFKNVS